MLSAIHVVLASLLSLSSAQTVQKPVMTVPSSMVLNGTYTIHCSTVSIGTKVNINWKWSGSVRMGPPTTCNALPYLPNGFSCRSALKFVAESVHIAKNLTCIATALTRSLSKSYMATMHFEVNGGWSTYRQIGVPKTCPVTCGTGEIFNMYFRCCNNPRPSSNGKRCVGDNYKVVMVNCTKGPC